MTFDIIEHRELPSLQAAVTLYRHAASGALHAHLSTSDDAEIAFLVGFPTLPMVGDGRAHVLEHLLLCGSERFPVKDPFFSMMRRSVATFMNAMTYPDRTVYPFATTDSADFFNLLDVYLDATFFPRLDRLSFLQEGWRPVLEEGKLALQGVVLNEMKGNYADPFRALHLGLSRALFADTTYGVDSGGDPLLIRSLTHQDLLDFHAQHYHPSQAVFMTSGAIDPQAVQAQIELRVLSRLSGTRPRQLPQLAPAWSAPRLVEITVPAAGAPETEYGLQMAWVLDPVSDQLACLRAELAMQVLAGHAGAPITRALQSVGFGRPSRMMGVDDSTRQLVLHIGMEGLLADQLDAARDCIQLALQQVAEQGVPADELQAALRTLRYRMRRATSPVNRLINIAQVGLRADDWLAAFDLEPVLALLAQEILDPEFLSRLVQRLLSEPTQLLAKVRPDSSFLEARDLVEQTHMAAATAALTPLERERIKADMAALSQHQQPADDAVLPRIRASDLAREPRALLLPADSAAAVQVVPLVTRGLTHAFLLADLSAIAPSDWPWLSLYAQLIPQLGAASMGFEVASAWRQARTPEFGVGLSTGQTVGGQLRVELQYSASSLREEQLQIAEVLQAWFCDPNWAEDERLAYLLQTMVEQRASAIVPMAAQFASLEAMMSVAPAAAFDREVHGLPSMSFYAELRRLLGQADGLAVVKAGLLRIQQQLLLAPRTLLCAGAAADAQTLAEALQAALPPSLPQAGQCTPAEAPQTRSPEPACAIALLVPSQVNDCTAILAVPRQDHADAPLLAVAAELLSQQLLHQMLREQGGAYGAEVHYNGEQGLFVIGSRDDPRLAQTYLDMAAALQLLAEQRFPDDALEQAVVSVIKRLDPPKPPVAELMRAVRMQRLGVDQAQRARFRSGVLTCTLDQVRAAAARWLVWADAAKAASVSLGTADLGGLQAIDLRQRAIDLGLAA